MCQSRNCRPAGIAGLAEEAGKSLLRLAAGVGKLKLVKFTQRSSPLERKNQWSNS